MKKLLALKTTGDALKLINHIKKYVPEEPPTYFVMPKKLFKKLINHKKKQ